MTFMQIHIQWLYEFLYGHKFYMRTLWNHNDITAFRKRHQLISLYKFQSPIKSTSTIRSICNDVMIIKINSTNMRTLWNHNDIIAFRKRHQLISFYKISKSYKININNRINMQWGIFIDACIKKLYISFWSIRCCSFWKEAGKIVDDDADCHQQWQWLRHQAMPIAYGLSASKLKTEKSH